jgi:mucin-19
MHTSVFSTRTLLQSQVVVWSMLCQLALAQVCATPGSNAATTSIAGIVNSYYPGTGANVGVGSASIPLGALDATGNTTAIAPGDLLMVVQMQGAEIDSSNSDCYGDGVGTAGCATRTDTSTSYAGGNLTGNYKAGTWEYCTATSAAGASVGVVCAGPGGGTANAYQASAATASVGAYRYQVIRVPQYSNVALTADVTPLAWNGSTGGVLAMQASGTVNMAGSNLNASGRGFRGGGVTFFAPYGPSLLDPVNGSSFYRAVAGNLIAPGPGGEREGNFKAEGVAGTPQLVYNGVAQVSTGADGYPNGSRGRGAPGNAGGGGNNQNGGGGGGGNGGAGGNGGGCWNDASRPITFRDCGGFGGDGANRAGNNLALSVSRIILGGGGGASHVDGGGTNCELGGWGGNGGGLIVLRAAAMTGAGNLLANGANGFAPNFTAGACTDGAGGAGSGGTIVAAVTAGLGGRSLQVSGGNGANSSYSQHGPGGGGGGGAIYYNTAGAAPATIATGGANGTDRGNLTPPAGPWFSTAGSGSVLAAPTSAFTPTCSTVLSVTKTNGVTTLQAGGTTSYTVTFVNSGATAADGAIAVDSPSAGLACTVQSCTPSATPIAAACPAPAQWPSLLTPGGVALPVLPALANVAFVVACNVTATGQ